MKKHIFILFLILAVLIFAGHQNTGSVVSAESVRENDAGGYPACAGRHASHAGGFEAFKDKAGNSYCRYEIPLMDSVLSGDSNVCISPYSLKEAMMMVSVGGKENTVSRNEIVKTFFGNTRPDNRKIAKRLKADRSLLTDDSLMQIKIANQVLVDNELDKSKNFDKKFKGILTRYYGADVKYEDLQSRGIVNKVNDFVSKNTNGMLKNIINKPFGSLCRLVLLNTSYFKGEWAEPFDKGGTFKEEFKGVHTASNIDMMHDVRYCLYKETKDYISIGLDYKSGNEDTSYTMYFILPKDNEKTVSDMYNNLTLKEKEELFKADGYEDEKVRITLPVFDFENSLNLNDALYSMGVVKPFSKTNRDFKNIARGRLSISDVQQMARIKVDEEGTEAAAATIVIVDVTSAPVHQEIKEFICDRPFMFLLKENKNDIILFSGAVNDLERK